MTKEEWKDIEGFEGLYKVSNMGRIQKNDGRYIASYGGNDNLYRLKSHLYKNNKQYGRTIVYLVARHFVPNPNNLRIARLIDKNVSEIHADNIIWLSGKDAGIGRKKGQKASMSTRAKMSKAKFKQISDGEVVYESILCAAELNYVTPQAISRNLRGISKTCLGKKWSYVEVDKK